MPDGITRVVGFGFVKDYIGGKFAFAVALNDYLR